LTEIYTRLLCVKLTLSSCVDLWAQDVIHFKMTTYFKAAFHTVTVDWKPINLSVHLNCKHQFL